MDDGSGNDDYNNKPHRYTALAFLKHFHSFILAATLRSRQAGKLLWIINEAHIHSSFNSANMG